MEEFALLHLPSLGKLWKSGGLLDLVFLCRFYPLISLPFNGSYSIGALKSCFACRWAEKIQNLGYEPKRSMSRKDPKSRVWVEHPKRSKISGMRSTRKEGISFTSVNRQLILSGFKWLTQPLPAENLAKCLTFRMEWRTDIWERMQAHSWIIRKHQTSHFNPCISLL